MRTRVVIASIGLSLSLAFTGLIGIGTASATPNGSMTFSNSGPASFSVPAGVQVIQAIASGGAGGAGTPTSGGLGCEVTGSISVNAGDTLSLFVGQNGTAGTGGAPGTGGHGGNGDNGSWSGAGGDGSGSTNAGAGGGGGSATALFDGTTSTIIAAGGAGGGNSSPGDGGSGCAANTSHGGNSLHSSRGGVGATTLSAGGASGGGAADAGNSYTQGGAGGHGGGGGGGGASGGGGGFIGTNGDQGEVSGGAGLSYVQTTNAGNLNDATYSPTSSTPSITINYVAIDAVSLPGAIVGSLYDQILSATFGGQIALTGTNARWSVTPPLPAGLTLNSTTGVISGTPTANATSTTYTVTAAELYNCVSCGSGFIIAQSSATATFAVTGGPTTTSPSAKSTAVAMLATTGSDLINPPWLAIALFGLGGGALLVSRRRKTQPHS